jgi:hypothetical protein
MTQLQASSSVQRAPLLASEPAHPFPALLGNRARLTNSLAAKRAAVASLKAAWVSAAEADAARIGKVWPGADRQVQGDVSKIAAVRVERGAIDWNRPVAC